MIISLHLPKTAGTSFGKSLEEYFGGQFLKDYGDLPMHKPLHKRHWNAIRDCCVNGFVRNFSDTRCIHGHFLPFKYLITGIKKKAKFITWLRDPVERLAFHYYYWQRTYDPDTAFPLHKRAVEENWSLERFCLGPELRNFYSQYLWGFPLGRFDFIGITEHFREDLSYFCETILGDNLPAYIENRNEELEGNKIYLTDSDFRRRIELYHEKDMKLYHQIEAKRLLRNCDSKA